MYSITVGLAEKVIKPHCYERLHDACVKLLRFIYLYRKRFDEMYVLSLHQLIFFRVNALTVFLIKIALFCSMSISLFLYSLDHVEETTYGYRGNEETKFAAATVYVSTLLSYPQIANATLNEIVRLTYLNESFLRKFSQSVHDFYLD